MVIFPQVGFVVHKLWAVCPPRSGEATTVILLLSPEDVYRQPQLLRSIYTHWTAAVGSSPSSSPCPKQSFSLVPEFRQACGVSSYEKLWFYCSQPASPEKGSAHADSQGGCPSVPVITLEAVGLSRRSHSFKFCANTLAGWRRGLLGSGGEAALGESIPIAGGARSWFQGED